jgi:putative oxidoreductase
MTETPLVLPALGALYTALGPWAEALLRFAVGAAMVPHGLRMSFGMFKNTGGPPGTLASVVQMYDRKGYRPGWFWAYCTVLTQFIAAPCVALGLFTRPMALPLFVLMVLSAYDHAKYDGYFWNKVGVEYPAMWATGVLYFLINGGGPISLDRLLLGFEL